MLTVTAEDTRIDLATGEKQKGKKQSMTQSKTLRQ